MSHAVIEYAEDPANFDVVPIKTHIRCDWVPQVGFGLQDLEVFEFYST